LLLIREGDQLQSSTSSEGLVDPLSIILTTMRRRWKMLVLIPAITTILAVIYVATTPRSWSGEALIEVGQYPGGDKSTPYLALTSGAYVEPPAAVTALVQSDPFKDIVIKKLGLEDEEAQRSLRQDIVARAIINTGLVSITFRGASERFVRKVLETIGVEIQQRHETMSAARRTALEDLIRRLSDERAKEQTQLNNAAKSKQPEAEDSIAATIEGVRRDQSLILAMQNIWNLQRDEDNARSGLSAGLWTPTRTTSVSTTRLSRGGAIVVALGLTGGIAAALVVVMLGASPQRRETAA
jgi:uncharacterized protein involved in exopolysaccharide biosynthesis